MRRDGEFKPLTERERAIWLGWTAEVERLNTDLDHEAREHQVTHERWMRLRTALLTIADADNPDAPISRETCAAIANRALAS